MSRLRIGSRFQKRGCRSRDFLSDCQSIDYPPRNTHYDAKRSVIITIRSRRTFCDLVNNFLAKFCRTYTCTPCFPSRLSALGGARAHVTSREDRANVVLLTTLSLTRLDHRHPSPREWATGIAPVPPIPSCWSRSCGTAACLPCARVLPRSAPDHDDSVPSFLLAFNDSISTARDTTSLGRPLPLRIHRGTDRYRLLVQASSQQATGASNRSRRAIARSTLAIIDTRDISIGIEWEGRRDLHKS